MLPLALIVKARGYDVEGSDRSLDAGRTASKFDFLKARGIGLHAQDGSGVTSKSQLLVTSAAVEDTVPDVVAAKALGCPQVTRPQLLAQLVNSAKVSIAVGGTSGKSTTTGMIAWILYATRRDPTVMNGAVMKNFVAGDFPFASAIVGEGDIFVSEVDESDGSIALYQPTIAVLNNIALDHKSMDELRRLFTDFVSKAQVAVFNLDNDETRRLASELNLPDALTYSLTDTNADFCISDLITQPDGQSCIVTEKSTGERQRICLQTPGRHNLSNGLAAIAAARACGLSLREATLALMNFVGIRRRLEVVGTAKDITVIDDFGHNPDKIAATLATLHHFPRPPARDVATARLWPHPPDERPADRDVRARPRREGHALHARARLFRRHRRQVDGLQRHRAGRHRPRQERRRPARPRRLRRQDRGTRTTRRPHCRDGRPR